MILDRPVEEWPECECLLSWYSDGFPLAKAQAYAALRHPFLVNDLHMQARLMFRGGVGWGVGWGGVSLVVASRQTHQQTTGKRQTPPTKPRRNRPIDDVLKNQDVLQDRRRVYRILTESGIPLPTHIIVDRDGLAEGEDPPGFVEEVRAWGRARGGGVGRSGRGGWS
jgi:hypothetical protein